MVRNWKESILDSAKSQYTYKNKSPIVFYTRNLKATHKTHGMSYKISYGICFHFCRTGKVSRSQISRSHKSH